MKYVIAAAITMAALAAAAAFPASARASAPTTAPVISTGDSVALAKHLEPERPTVFVFLKPSSSLERSFLSEVQRDAGGQIGFRAIHLKNGDEAVARQYAIKETPSALVYDRRGRLVGRGSDAPAIRAAVTRAAGVMRIDWAEEGDALFLEGQRLLGGPPTAGIIRTMSLKPEYMASIAMLAGKAHFADGYLNRRTKEMIATYVSALNKCKY